MSDVIIYTDGGKRGSSKIGAFAHVTQLPDKQDLIEESVIVSEEETRKVTNQTMELSAVIHAIENIPKEYLDEHIIIHSDSAYVVNCFLDEWWVRWEENGWVNTKQQPIANQQLWMYLVEQYKTYDIEMVKVKGHSDVELNNLCDKLLNDAMDEWEKENK